MVYAALTNHNNIQALDLTMRLLYSFPTAIATKHRSCSAHGPIHLREVKSLECMYSTKGTRDTVAEKGLTQNQEKDLQRV
jgi:hypothetical protein